VITADMTDPNHAWLRIAVGRFAQQITLVSRPRHYGGRQWFFLCPVTGGVPIRNLIRLAREAESRNASVL
jgi:hypothetical protein